MVREGVQKDVKKQKRTRKRREKGGREGAMAGSRLSGGDIREQGTFSTALPSLSQNPSLQHQGAPLPVLVHRTQSRCKKDPRCHLNETKSFALGCTVPSWHR